MKRTLRGSLAFFLVCLLAIFSLWRYERLSVIADATTYLTNAIERLGDLKEIVRPEDGGGEGGDSTPTAPTDPDSDFSDYNPSATVDTALQETILAGLLAMEGEIDLSAHTPTREELSLAMANIVYSTPELFYLDATYSFSTGSDQRVRALTPAYTHTKADVATMREEYDAALAAIVADAPKTGSDFAKILYLHDYFVRNYCYDNTLTIRDAHTFFTQKTGVCQAYMLGLIAAAKELGIESLPVTSDAMKHAWNLVKVDGAWYHVDITWDDSNSLPTRVNYTYFLQSDAGLAAIDAARPEADRHRAWSAAEPATATKYDSALFHAANTGIVTYGDEYYVAVKDDTATGKTVRGTIYYGTDPTALEKFADITGGVFAAGAGSYYTGCYCDLLLVGNILYYNSGNSVGYVDLSLSGATHRVLFPAGLAAYHSIYGFLGVKEGKLLLVTATAPNATAYQTVAMPLP